MLHFYLRVWNNSCQEWLQTPWCQKAVLPVSICTKWRESLIHGQQFEEPWGAPLKKLTYWTLKPIIKLSSKLCNETSQKSGNEKASRIQELFLQAKCTELTLGQVQKGPVCRLKCNGVLEARYGCESTLLSTSVFIHHRNHSPVLL